ncbi:MAG: hypothetical protein KJO33_03920 [Gammaproteobacteria bacterium]|nr:hypothetical protein [Gammaproteobacteria bacterium]
MDGFLSNLARRHTGNTANVVPRVRSRFEEPRIANVPAIDLARPGRDRHTTVEHGNPPGEPGPLHEIATRSTADARASAESPAAGILEPVEDLERAREPVRQGTGSRGDSGTGLVDRPLRPSQSPAVELNRRIDAVLARLREVAGSENRDDLGPGAEGARLSDIEPQHGIFGSEPSAETAPGTAWSDTETRKDARPPDASDTGRVTGLETDISPPAWVNELQASFRDRRAPSGEAPEPVINVSIGCVQVNAVPESGERKATRKKPPAVMSLDEYLQQKEQKGQK